MPRVDVNARIASRGIDMSWITVQTISDGNGPPLGRSVPIFTAVPADLGVLASNFAAAKTAGAPAVIRLSCNGYPLEPWTLSPIPEFAEREDCCLMLDFGDRGEADRWSVLVQLARHYPHLPLLALDMPLNSPIAGKALDATPNVVFETYDEPELRDLCDRYGAHRFTYGSAGRAIATPRLDGDALEQVVWTTATQLSEGRWGSAYL